MKAITIRGVDPELAQTLKHKAEQQGKSVNRFVLDMLRDNLGFDGEKKYSRTYDDLDHLFGRWSEAEFNRIQEKIDHERTIDAEIWE